MSKYAGLLIKCKDRYLLCKRSEDAVMPGLWSVPAGQVNTNEEPDEAAVRETYEETQIPVQVEDTAYVATLNGSAHDGGDFYVYMSEIVDEVRPILNFEHVASGWFMRHSLPTPIDSRLKDVVLGIEKIS